MLPHVPLASSKPIPTLPTRLIRKTWFLSGFLVKQSTPVNYEAIQHVLEHGVGDGAGVGWGAPPGLAAGSGAGSGRPGARKDEQKVEAQESDTGGTRGKRKKSGTKKQMWQVARRLHESGPTRSGEVPSR